VHLANHYAWKAMKFTRYDNLLKDGVFEALGISKVDFQTFFERFMKNSY
jgi:hypothetical protein